MKELLTEDIFKVTGSLSFERMALKVFRFQAAECREYSEYVRLLGIDPARIENISAIPFMPVSFFRDHIIMTGGGDPEKVFLSSGTAGMRQSRHALRSLALYDESLERAFRIFYGSPSQYAIMGLLPSYLEREGSSLIYMVNRLMTLSGNDNGGFFLDDYAGLLRSIKKSRAAGLRVLLIGVTFALLDMAERCPEDLSDVIIMETGGMKGRRREMIREELHEVLKSAFGVPSVHSEYGMTELLSQAYSSEDGLFMTPPWMKVLIRDSHDPMSHTGEAGAAGGISVIDLANINSCSFIATADLGRMHRGGRFEVLGRYDNSDVRGCSLLIT
ncbi:MAG: acyltransferase [Bacteroidales bacterium]|nr:acyltransferase [Bacteroidales bacterium]